MLAMTPDTANDLEARRILPDMGRHFQLRAVHWIQYWLSRPDVTNRAALIDAINLLQSLGAGCTCNTSKLL